jgi:hypothetical protein
VKTDRTPGDRSVTVPVGAGGVTLPGNGVADNGQDYYIVATVNDGRQLQESDYGNDSAVLSGVYLGNHQDVYVQGTEGGDHIRIASTDAGKVSAPTGSR